MPTVPLTPRRASSVGRNLSSRKVARSNRYSDPGRARPAAQPATDSAQPLQPSVRRRLITGASLYGPVASCRARRSLLASVRRRPAGQWVGKGSVDGRERALLRPGMRMSLRRRTYVRGQPDDRKTPPVGREFELSRSMMLLVDIMQRYQQRNQSV